MRQKSICVSGVRWKKRVGSSKAVSFARRVSEMAVAMTRISKRCKSYKNAGFFAKG